MSTEHPQTMIHIEGVELKLAVCHGTGHDVLFSLRQIAVKLQLFLSPSEDVAQEETFELLDTSARHFSLHFSSFREPAYHNCVNKLILEERKITEQAWLYEAEQTPQLLQIVLHRCARENHFVMSLKTYGGIVYLRL